jgi:putative transposase
MLIATSNFRVLRRPFESAHYTSEQFAALSLKTERTANKSYRTRDEARAEVFDYIERLQHDTQVLDHRLSQPVEFERKGELA